MKTFLQFINEDLDINSKLNGDTHSIIDGLNRSKNATMNNNNQIHAKIIDQNNLKPLSKKEADDHDKIAAAARKKGDYFTGSTFGDGKQRYSVQHAIDHSKTVPTQKISTNGFVSQQVKDYWQGDINRAKNAVPSADKPILIMKHQTND